MWPSYYFVHLYIMVIYVIDFFFFNLFAYLKATVGQCNTKKPGITDFVGQAKWEAWNSVGNLSQVRG